MSVVIMVHGAPDSLDVSMKGFMALAPTTVDSPDGLLEGARRQSAALCDSYGRLYQQNRP